MFGVTCTCSWLELFVVIWSWVKNDAAPFLGVGGLVGGYFHSFENICIGICSHVDVAVSEVVTYCFKFNAHIEKHSSIAVTELVQGHV